MGETRGAKQVQNKGSTAMSRHEIITVKLDDDDNFSQFNAEKDSSLIPKASEAEKNTSSLKNHVEGGTALTP